VEVFSGVVAGKNVYMIPNSRGSVVLVDVRCSAAFVTARIKEWQSKDRTEKVKTAFKQCGKSRGALALEGLPDAVGQQSFRLGSCCTFSFTDDQVPGGFRFYVGKIMRMMVRPTAGGQVKRIFHRIGMTEFATNELFFQCAWLKPILAADQGAAAVLSATEYKYGPATDNVEYISAAYLVCVVDMEYNDGVFLLGEDDLKTTRDYIQRQAVLEAPDEDDVDGEADDETDTRAAKKTKRKQDGGGLDDVLLERAPVERAQGKRKATSAKGR